MADQDDWKKFKWEFRLIKILFYILGGFYYSKNISKAVKWVWIGWMSIFIVAFSFGLIYALTITRNFMRIDDIFLMVILVVCNVTCLAIIPSTTIYFRKEIDLVFSYIKNFHEKLKLQNPSTDPEFFLMPFTKIIDHGDHKEIVGRQKLTPIVAVLANGIFLSVSELYILIPAINFVFAYNEGDYAEVKDYLFAIPFYNRTTSLTSYWAIVVFTIVTSLPMFLIAASLPNFILLMCILLNNIVIDQCETMSHLSRIWTLENEQILTFKSTNQDIVPYCDVENILTSFIREYNTFWRVTKKIEPYISLVCTFVLLGLNLVQLANIYVVLGTDVEYAFKIRQVIMIINIAIYTFVVCYIGKIFDDLTDVIRYEVYNLPWYLLPPRRRRVLHIFQTKVLKPFTFKAAYIFPASMALFAKMAQTVFTYYNILHTVLTR